ncbi:MAG: hypothetical protein ABI721_03705 [Candidatus Dojkabacteria bacterium]
MKAKNLIFLSLVFIIVAAGVITTIFLLASTPVIHTTNPPVSKPVSSSTDGNIISINDGNIDNFDIALITSEDTIQLKNSQNEIIPINLDKTNWKDIKWSPDGKLLSVLGKSGENIFDLYIFNLKDRLWKKATTFNQTNTGIDSYIWKDSNIILFTQGTAPEHWIHQYIYVSGEITKLNKTEGTLFAIAADAKSMVVKLNSNNDESSFAFFNTDGTLAYNLNKVLNSTDNKALVISNIVYTKDSNNIILSSMDGKVYRHTFGNSNAIEITNAKNFYPLCGVTEKVVLGVQKNEEDKLFVDTFNIDNTPLVNIASKSIGDLTIDFSKTKCYKTNNVALSLSNGDWLNTENNQFEDFFLIDVAKEVSFRDLSTVNL